MVRHEVGVCWPLVILLLLLVVDKGCVVLGRSTTPGYSTATLSTPYLPMRPSTPPKVDRTTPGHTPPAHTTNAPHGFTFPLETVYTRVHTKKATISTTTETPTTTSTPLPTTPQLHFTNAPGDGGNLTGPNVCVRQVTETRYAWQTVTFACHRTTTVKCYECQILLNCQYINLTHCERNDAGTCSATVYQYQPVDVTVRECCNGFEHVGNECHVIKACENGNGGCNHLCRKNANTGIYCECFNGYQLNGTACIDWDECHSNNGGCSHTCTNTMGSFYCTCPSGYRLDSPTSCNEVNECENFNGGCAQKCVNTQGRHYCECRPGFTLANGTNCQDIDECASGYRCQHKCHNFIGNYICTCPEGETLKSDNSSCSGVKVNVKQTDREVLTSIPMIATLSAVGALVLIVLMIWIVCCYLKGPCWCCDTSSPNNKASNQRQDESIVMQYRGRGEGKVPPPYYETNGGYTSDTLDYNTHARNPNGLHGREEITADDIHILSG